MLRGTEPRRTGARRDSIRWVRTHWPATFRPPIRLSNVSVMCAAALSEKLNVVPNGRCIALTDDGAIALPGSQARRDWVAW